MEYFRRLSRHWVHAFLIMFGSMLFTLPAAQAGIIGTDKVINQQQLDDTRNQVQRLFNEQTTVEQLKSLGIDPVQAQNRIDSMTDEEVARLADNMENMPAGSGALGTLAFVFIVLLVTDILGYTDIFPFVKKAR